MADRHVFDASKIKPGWSLSKINNYKCPLRFARLYIEGRKEQASDAALVGRIVAVVMAEARLRWIESGADTRHSGHLDMIASRAAEEDGAQPQHVERAMEIVSEALSKRWDDLMPERARVARYWIEERLAFDANWERITFSAKDAKWWGTAEQRRRTWFRCVPDFAWIDTDGVLHIEDDKSGWGKVGTEQVQAYGYAVGMIAGSKRPVEIRCRYNLLGQLRIDEHAPVSHDEVAGFPDWLKARVNEILATDDWRPVMGKHCDWCGFVAECPAHQTTAGQLETMEPDSFRAITTMDQAIRGALWLMAAERCVKIAKEKLREYVEEHGAVEIPETGKRMEIRPVTEREAPAADVLGALLELGIPKDVILGRLTLRPKHAEAILKKQWPLSGKGVTADVKAANRQARAHAEAVLADIWEEKPRRGLFGVFVDGG